MSRFSTAAAGLLAMGTWACAAPGLEGVENESGTGGCREESEDGVGPRTTCPRLQIGLGYAVDILFVIDNTGSMGHEQGRVAAAMDAFIDALEVRGHPMNYRIAVTTTDNGNPWCGATLLPMGGDFVLRSCRGRLEEFVFTGTDPETVATDLACTDHCDFEPEQLDDLIKPTPTGLDPTEKRRPWMQRVAGETNLPDGIAEAEAAACFLPQGIAGCGFESHLESMYEGLQRTKSEAENSYGFVRDDAVLAVVFVTDEVDCSYRQEFQEIFDADGGKVFWSDPDAEYPSSALCWNAGVACTGGPGEYEACEPADFDVAGANTSEELAVLHPVGRYQDLLQGFENAKKMLAPDQEVIVSVIGGVPAGYASGAAEIPYGDAADPVFQADFGIGPGCTGEDTKAVPPVRLRAVADAFGERMLHSACEQDYAPALEALAAQIAAQMPPACYEKCAADVDPDQDGLQVECVLQWSSPGEILVELEACESTDGTWQLPDGTDVCWFPRTDASQSGDPIDDLSDACIEDGFNLEFDHIRRPGTAFPDGTEVNVQCRSSASPSSDCPNLG